MANDSMPDCPLLNEPCHGENCAWFVEKQKRCAVPVLAENVEKLGEKVEDLSGEILDHYLLSKKPPKKKK